ncbi:hypothetical protein NDN08_001765 [Rhodosorus marinus]|uniref:RING-type domain-containing protein n=1 Tax=Rhodosorus marinus TaxID=101924 RepID=A0AAV8UW29_9RHOD|nr:hypothetical protein NDN08_001765 [Rhodosorus marinus]
MENGKVFERGYEEEAMPAPDQFRKFDSPLSMKTAEEYLETVREEFEADAQQIVKSVAQILRNYRSLDKKFLGFGYHKRAQKVYDEAKDVEETVNSAEKRLEEIVRGIDTGYGGSIARETFVREMYPLLENSRQSIHDLAIRSELLKTTDEEPPEDFCCLICMDLLYHPVTLMCGHRYCEHCMKLASKRSSKCPLCRRDGMMKHGREDTELNAFLKKRYPDAYRGRQIDRFQRQQREYEKVLVRYERVRNMRERGGTEIESGA